MDMMNEPDGTIYIRLLHNQQQHKRGAFAWICSNTCLSRLDMYQVLVYNIADESRADLLLKEMNL